jgi:hypothetical protein
MNSAATPPWSWKSTLVCVFVTLHLAILLFRNPLDLWWQPIETWAEERPWWKTVQPIYEPIDRWTRRYDNLLGIEQGWTMFQPPVARGAPFLGARLYFTDGTNELIISDNELGRDYFRLGGWRQRKVEDYLVYATPEKLPNHDELALWEGYARWRIRTWQERHPDDGREVAKVELVKRRYEFPAPGERAEDMPGPEESVVGTFGPDGKLR